MFYNFFFTIKETVPPNLTDKTDKTEIWNYWLGSKLHILPL
jgi:hypothetical protein